ncbi:MAG: YihY/virulence factor BrkB family protein [Nocardioides sp.]|nr:YihY/virulence factor BrkB family protein [Nocardioides sp.]
MGRVADGLDRFQRRHRVLGIPIAVVYKFFDDQSNYLAAIMTYYAFIAIFPLMLLASSIFGFVLQGRPELQQEVLNSALSQFPIIGDQLGRPEGLRGSSTGAVVGGLAALYGSLGLGQAIQNAMNVAWSVPRNSRPNPFLLRLKSLALLLSAGLAVLAVSILSALGSNTQVFSRGTDLTIRILISAATALLVGALLSLLFRFAVARHLSLRKAAPGAFVVAILWQLLQYVGATYATHVLAQTTSMNKTFGLVLGLIGLIYLAAVMAMLGIQVNVVLVRHLWPRALLTPFTDAVELTDADRRAYESYARAQRHKGFESVEVTFDDLPAVRDDATD